MRDAGNASRHSRCFWSSSSVVKVWQRFRITTGFQVGGKIVVAVKGRVCSVLYPPGLFFHTSCQGSEISTVCFLSNIMELDGNRLKANGANNKAAGKKCIWMTRQQGFFPEFMSQILKIIDRRRNSTEGRLHLTEKTFVLVTARNEKHPWDVMLASIVSLHEWTFFYFKVQGDFLCRCTTEVCMLKWKCVSFFRLHKYRTNIQLFIRKYTNM